MNHKKLQPAYLYSHVGSIISINKWRPCFPFNYTDPVALLRSPKESTEILFIW